MRRRVSRIARRSLAVSGWKLAAVRRDDRRHRRTHGVAWNVEEATVANDVTPGDVLAGGRLVKVAMTGPYYAPDQ